MSTSKFDANAKINLGLEILGKRPDGFHEINTVFAKISLADEILLKPSDKLKVTVEPDLDIPGHENLVYIAAEKIKNIYGLQGSGADIHIRKNIPHSAGLGGGSSDAAVTLIGLSNMWNLTLSESEYETIALEIGSDVPYFLRHGAAIGRGRGENLEYFNLDFPFSILLVSPGINISTKWAYQSLGMTADTKNPADFKNTVLQAKNDPSVLKHGLFNDFEQIVFKEFPKLAEIKEQLYSSGAIYSQMTGSGSTIFGIFPDDDMSRKAASFFPDYDCNVCHLI